MNSAGELISRMTSDVEVWLSGKEVDLESKYRAPIEAVGLVPFLTELFRRLADATLTNWMIRLIFVWKDLPFEAWKRILHGISEDAPAIYQFVSFTSRFLAIDVVRLIHDDPQVAEAARVFATALYPNGGPGPSSSWVREVLEEHGVDIYQLWRRFASEGAPMKIDPAKLGQ